MGAIFWIAAASPPDGYLECNGQSTSGYPELAALVGSFVPDLRGAFVRGWDHGRGIDVGRNFKSWQNDAFQGHWHEAWSANSGGGGWVYDNGTNGYTKNPWPALSPIRDPIRDGYNGNPRTAAETRPVNVALLPCIRALP